MVWWSARPAAPRPSEIPVDDRLTGELRALVSSNCSALLAVHVGAQAARQDGTSVLPEEHSEAADEQRLMI